MYIIFLSYVWQKKIISKKLNFDMPSGLARWALIDHYHGHGSCCAWAWHGSCARMDTGCAVLCRRGSIMSPRPGGPLATSRIWSLKAQNLVLRIVLSHTPWLFTIFFILNSHCCSPKTPTWYEFTFFHPKQINNKTRLGLLFSPSIHFFVFKLLKT